MEHTFYRRLLSAVCAIALAFTAVCPAVAAAPEDTTGTPQTLTVSEVQEMQQTDAAVTALTDSAAYAGMSEEERQAAALAQLDVLAAQGLVEKDSIYVDAENGMVSFAYRCGALGGILLASQVGVALPTCGIGSDMDVIASVVLGGVSLSGGCGKVSGTLLGALILQTISNGMTLLSVQSYWQMVIKGIVLILAVLIDVMRSKKR